MIWLGIDIWPTSTDGVIFGQAMAFLGASHALILASLYATGNASARKDANKVWFPLHTLANAYVCYYALPDLTTTLLNPLAALEVSKRGMGATHGMVMAVHIYHIAAFYHHFTGEDWAHHIISVGGVGTMAYLFRWGNVIDAMNVFVCGLPGGLDYLLLTLVKFGMIEKITEKRLNMWLQTLIRWPGIFLMLYSSVISKLKLCDSSTVGWIPIFLVCLLHGYNGIYYAQKVTGNTHINELQLREAKKAKKEG